jgi:hypothetical protein
VDSVAEQRNSVDAPIEGLRISGPRKSAALIPKPLLKYENAIRYYDPDQSDDEDRFIMQRMTQYEASLVVLFQFPVCS